MDAELQTLRWFVVVAESSSFSKAAARLNVARQRLSAAMLELEGDNPLFDRAAGGTALTDAGRKLLEEARARVSQADAQPQEADLDEDEAEPDAGAAEPTAFPITIVAGVTVSKWTTRWEERHKDRPVSVLLVEDAVQVDAVRAGTADCAFVRLPLARSGPDAVAVHTIPLYTEDAVVIAAKGHLIEAADVVELADLVGERLLSAPDSLPGWAAAASDPGTAQQRAQLDGLTPSQLIEVVATGAGIAVLPASVVRASGRKDVISRPLAVPPQSTVALSWRVGDDSIETERFVGIVRGRTERSSRAEPTPPTAKKRGSAAVGQRSSNSHAARRKRR